MSRVVSLAVAVVLGAAAAWLLRPGDREQRGAALEPARVVLRAGETAEIRLTLHEFDAVALRFRLRFDESVVALEAARPEHTSVLTGGNAIHLPSRRSPGLLEVPGTAVVGGRAFEPFAPVYRFTFRGVSPETTVVAVEDLSIVDRGDMERAVVVVPCRVAVRGD
jgi:hypothetical protein